mgnify:CR=1 FL=1
MKVGDLVQVKPLREGYYIIIGNWAKYDDVWELVRVSAEGRKGGPMNQEFIEVVSEAR